jgi:protein SCO1/2
MVPPDDRPSDVRRRRRSSSKHDLLIGAMKIPETILIALLLTAATVASSAAHSLGELEGMLGDREKYSQPIDREAPDFALEDAEGGAVALDDLRGKVVVLHFVYTNCPDVCPLHAERIAEIQAMINRTPMRELVQFVTITTDPEHDTPEVMRAYGPAHGLDPVNWMFLPSGPDRAGDTTRNLAERFGHTFTQTEEGYQIHGVVTHVIDREGRWQANFHGLEFEPTNLVLYINALTHPHADERHSSPSWWDRIVNLF